VNKVTTKKQPAKSRTRNTPAGTIDGTVVSVNGSGDLVTDIANECLADIPHDESVTVKFGPHETICILPSDHGEPDATMVASLGETGFLQIEIVGISLSDMLGIQPGVAVSVTW